MSEGTSLPRSVKITRPSQTDFSDGEITDSSNERLSRSSYNSSRFRRRSRNRRNYHDRHASPHRHRSSRHRSRSRSSRISRKNRRCRKPKRSNSESSISGITSPNKDYDKCPICLKELIDQKTAIPDSCSFHRFCFECLEEWSKYKNTCPVDRKEYNSILALDNDGKKVVDQVPIGFRNRVSSNSAEPSFCEICGGYQDEELLVQCDGCGTGFHAYCLNPPLPRVPNGMWLCYECSYYNY